MSAESQVRTDETVREGVRSHYGRLAEEAGARASCCGEQPVARATCCGGDSGNGPRPAPSERPADGLYNDGDLDGLPAEVTDLSLGSGNPVALAELGAGESVIDLGSGGGIDCFLAARRVGDSGRVIGVDMTAQMIDQARRNLRKIEAGNVEFRLGEIEHLPVADASVDVVISNCVINLSPDKPQVFREAYRVLKPGGRIAISDIMTSAPLPDAVRKSLSAWAGCVGGALDEASYVAAVEAAGFVDVKIDRVHFEQKEIDDVVEELDLPDEAKDSRHLVVRAGDQVEVIELEEGFDREAIRPFSGKLTARKPA